MKHAALCIGATALLVAMVFAGLTCIIRATQPPPQPQGDTRDLIAENDRLNRALDAQEQMKVTRDRDVTALTLELNRLRTTTRATTQP